MTELWESLQPAFRVLPVIVGVALWCLFWLLCVDWRKLWTVLAHGAWAGVALLWFISAVVWSRLDPRDYDALGFVSLPNFWWQLIAIGKLIGLALFFGWLQGVIRYAPPEMSVEMPTGHDSHGHDHGHDHAAGDGHAHHH